MLCIVARSTLLLVGGSVPRGCQRNKYRSSPSFLSLRVPESEDDQMSRQRRVLGIGECEHCGSNFVLTDERLRFCSRPCILNLVRPRAKPKYKKVKPCQWCGSNIDRPRGLKYCGSDCNRRALKAHLWPARPAFVCRECGVLHQPVQGEKRRAYCSEMCLVHASRRQAKRSDVAAKSRRYRQQLHDKRGRLFERDNWACYLCGTQLRRDVTAPHPLSPSLDHVVPISAGGSNDLSNVRSAHFGCNVEKGDRLPYSWERDLSYFGVLS